MSDHNDVDFLGLSADLSQEERTVQAEARAFVDEQVLPIIEEHFLEGSFPTHLIPEMGKRGYLGAILDGYGCRPLSGVSYGLMNQELERGDSAIRSFSSVQTGLVMFPIFTFGTEEQKKQWLPELASGRAVGCFGLTEPDFGSNPGGMVTAATIDGNDYVLNGKKRWATNGSIANVAVIWAKLDGDVRGFLVEKDTPGFKPSKIVNKFSLRASVSSEIELDQVRIPKRNLLPGTEVGLRAPLLCLNQARYGIAWGAVGAARGCYEEALAYTKKRVQFTRPLAGHQLIQHKLVEMLTDVTQGQLLCLRLGRMKDAGTLKHYHISMAKRTNVRNALSAARMTRDMLGARGICTDSHCARHLCNLETVSTYEGTHDIHTLILGEHITGLNAFS